MSYKRINRRNNRVPLRYTQLLPRELTHMIADFADIVVVLQFRNIEEFVSAYRQVRRLHYQQSPGLLQIAAIKYAASHDDHDTAKSLYQRLHKHHRLLIASRIIDCPGMTMIRIHQITEMTDYHRRELVNNIHRDILISIDDPLVDVITTHLYKHKDIKKTYRLCMCSCLDISILWGEPYSSFRYVRCAQCGANCGLAKAGTYYQIILDIAWEWYNDKRAAYVIDGRELSSAIIAEITKYDLIQNK
jgi:hypothetical protein